MRARCLSLDSCESARELCVVLTTGRASAQPPPCLLRRLGSIALGPSLLSEVILADFAAVVVWLLSRA